MTATNFVSNSATGGPSGSGGVGGFGLGGGILVGGVSFLVPQFSPDGSSVSLSDISLAGNTARGSFGDISGNGLGGALAVVGDDAATIGASTITANEAEGGQAPFGGNGGDGFGGGIYVDSGSNAGVFGSTITLNQAIGHSSHAGGIGQGVGGGVYYLGTFTFDPATTISENHASTSNDNIFPA